MMNAPCQMASKCNINGIKRKIPKGSAKIYEMYYKKVTNNDGDGTRGGGKWKMREKSTFTA